MKQELKKRIDELEKRIKKAGPNGWYSDLKELNNKLDFLYRLYDALYEVL